MKLVNINGGHSIGVYDSETKDKTKVYNMFEENRIKYFVPADYTKNSKLETLVKHIIDRTASNEILERIKILEQKLHPVYDSAKMQGYGGCKGVFYILIIFKTYSSNFSFTRFV